MNPNKISLKDLRALALDELAAKEKTLKEELFKLNLQRYTGRIDKPHMYSKIKKDIARVKTVINENLKTK